MLLSLSVLLLVKQLVGRLEKVVRVLIKVSLGRVDLLIVQSGQIREQFKGLVEESKICILPNCIDIKFVDNM